MSPTCRTHPAPPPPLHPSAFAPLTIAPLTPAFTSPTFAPLSVWTIDLAHLLALFRVRVSFLTITIGADHSYANEAFYAPQWGSDTARVQRLFDCAPQAGISVSLRR